MYTIGRHAGKTSFGIAAGQTFFDGAALAKRTTAASDDKPGHSLVLQAVGKTEGSIVVKRLGLFYSFLIAPVGDVPHRLHDQRTAIFHNGIFHRLGLTAVGRTRIVGAVIAAYIGLAVGAERKIKGYVVSCYEPDIFKSLRECVLDKLAVGHLVSEYLQQLGGGGDVGNCFAIFYIRELAVLFDDPYSRQLHLVAFISAVNKAAFLGSGRLYLQALEQCGVFAAQLGLIGSAGDLELLIDLHFGVADDLEGDICLFKLFAYNGGVALHYDEDLGVLCLKLGIELSQHMYVIAADGAADIADDPENSLFTKDILSNCHVLSVCCRKSEIGKHFADVKFSHCK